MIRGLKSEDAPLMLEWMLDSSVVKMMNRNFSEMTIEDCNSFIEKNKLPSDVDKEGLVEELKKRGCAHLAIVDISDEYLGTVSLKNIDFFCYQYHSRHQCENNHLLPADLLLSCLEVKDHCCNKK